MSERVAYLRVCDFADAVVELQAVATDVMQDGTIDGNINCLSECVRRVVKFGIPFEDAVYCATYNPAKRIGVEDRKGSIAEGKDADLVVLDDSLDIKYVIKNGEIKYKNI